MKSNLEIRIVAVPQRKAGVEYLKQRLNTEASVYYDFNKIGCIKNCLRAWSEPCKPETTHLAVLQDDIDVIDNFKAAAERIGSNFEDAIIAVCEWSLKESDKKDGTPYVLMKRPNLKGQGIIMPVKYKDAFIRFYHSNLEGYPHDDASIRMFAFMNDIPVIGTIPALGQHLGYADSAISKTHNAHNELSRISKVWAGHNPVVDWNTKDYAISRAFALNTHLKKDHPLQIKIDEKERAKTYEHRVSQNFRLNT